MQMCKQTNNLPFFWMSIWGYERESVPTDSVKISDFTAEIKCLQPDAKIVLASVDVFLHNVAALTESRAHTCSCQLCWLHLLTELDLNALLEHFSAIIRKILWCRLQVVQPLLRKDQHGDGQNARAQFSKPKIQKQAGKPCVRVSFLQWHIYPVLVFTSMRTKQKT